MYSFLFWVIKEGFRLEGGYREEVLGTEPMVVVVLGP